MPDAEQLAITARTPSPSAAQGVTTSAANRSEAAAGVATSRHNGTVSDAAHCMPERDVNTPSHSGGPRPPDDAAAATADPLRALTEPAAQLHSPADRSVETQRSLIACTTAASMGTDEQTVRVNTEAHAASSSASSPSTSPEPQPDVWQRDAAGAASDTATQTGVPLSASPSTPTPAGEAESADKVDAADMRPAASDDDARASVRYAALMQTPLPCDKNVVGRHVGQQRLAGFVITVCASHVMMHAGQPPLGAAESTRTLLSCRRRLPRGAASTGCRTASCPRAHPRQSPRHGGRGRCGARQRLRQSESGRLARP